MGGWMDYERMRRRNNIQVRGEGFYVPITTNVNVHMLNGDMNRMEADYLHPESSWLWRQRLDAIAAGHDVPDWSPAAVCARETGVDVDTVRKVLGHVFAIPEGTTKNP